jgi:signal recognition particle GTPase
MGLTIAKFFTGFWSKMPTRIVMVGLDAAGKTTVFFLFF